MAKTVKAPAPVKAPEVLTKEITTNPTPKSFLVDMKVLGDLGHHCYACTIGQVYPFPRHVAEILVKEGKAQYV